MVEYQDVWADALKRVVAGRREDDGEFVLNPNSKTAELLLIDLLEKRWGAIERLAQGEDMVQVKEQLTAQLQSLESTPLTDESSILPKDYWELMRETADALLAAYRARINPEPQAVAAHSLNL